MTADITSLQIQAVTQLDTYGKCVKRGHTVVKSSCSYRRPGWVPGTHEAAYEAFLLISAYLNFFLENSVFQLQKLMRSLRNTLKTFGDKHSNIFRNTVVLLIVFVIETGPHYTVLSAVELV